MKSLKQVMEITPLATTNSSKSLATHSSLSIYKDELTKECIVECNLIIRQAFPTLTQGFFVQLNRLIKENSFTDQRLREATDYVISTCVYPQPTIAQFLSYDTRIDLYTYQDIVKMTDTNRHAFTDYKLVESLGKYASVHDIKKYSL